MSTVLLVVFGIVFAIAGLVLIFLWLMCRGRGLEAAAARPALIAGVVLLALAVLWIGPALAHDPYSGWTQPKTGKSCCNQMSADRSSGDCRPERAYPGNDGHWYVLLNGRWKQVPPDRILPRPSPDLSSHVCANVETDEILCFVPGPNAG